MKQLISALMLLVGIVGGSNAQSTQADPATGRSHAFMTVDYSDTFQGLSGMLAVRACATEDEPQPVLSNPSVIPSAPPMLARIEERQAATEHDILVRVVAADGREVLRHEGTTDVCGFARLAGAFLALDRARSTRVDQ